MLGSILAKQAKKNSASEKNDKLSRYLEMFNRAWKYAEQNYHARWHNNWELYHNKRVSRSHDGVVHTFVPLVRSSVDTIVASLFNSNPAINYIPNHPDQEADTKVLNELYADFARKDRWVQKNKVGGRQGVITGNFCTYYEWVPDKSGDYVHKINVPIRDMIIDPTSHGFEDWKYVGRRIFASLKSLEAETIYDAEQDEYVPRYKNLEQVVGGSDEASDYESDKSKKDQSLGSVAPGNKDEVELIEIWTNKEVVVIANRKTIIEERDNPYYALEKSAFEQRKLDHELKLALGEDIGEFNEEFDEEHAGLLPFAHGRMYEDISLPYGDSDVDIIAEQQELLNDLTEMSLEATLYALYPERTIDPAYTSLIDDLEPGPGKVFPVPAGAMNWNNPAPLPSGLLNERANIKDEIREAISVSQISKGVAATDDITATEIKATLGRGDIRIQEKAQTLANDFFVQEARIVLRLVQLYAPEEMYVRTIQDAKVSFEEVDPTRFLGEYTPMVTLDVQKRYEENEEKEANLQAYQILIQDPTNNLAAVKKHLLPKIIPSLSKEQIAEIITQTQAMPTTDLGSMPATNNIDELASLQAGTTPMPQEGETL